MTFKKIKKSFGYAWQGIVFFLEERNIKIHLAMAFLVTAMGFYFKIKTSEWIGVILSIVLVLSLEIINTVVEEVMDLTHPDKDGKIMKIKDMSAASVFVAALGSVIIGLIIFIPYLSLLLQ